MSYFSIDPATYANNIEYKSARIPNGTGSFLMTTQITQGTQNPDPTPEPTSSPSPTPYKFTYEQQSNAGANE